MGAQLCQSPKSQGFGGEPVESPQYSGGIGAAATQASPGRDPFGQLDVGAVTADLAVIEIRRPPGEVFSACGQSGIGAIQGDVRRQRYANRVAKAHGLEDAEQIMEAILPPRQYLQAQVQFGAGALLATLRIVRK